MRWIIHLGLPKAASTAIQDEWKQINSFYYVGKWKSDKTAGRIRRPVFQTEQDGEVVRNILPHCGLAQLPLGELQAWVSSVESRAKADGHEVIGLSDEGLSGIGFGVGDFPTDIGAIMQSLSRLLGDRVTFVLVAREPNAWCRSYYSTRVNQGLGSRFDEFIAWQLALPYASILQGVNYPGIFRFADRRKMRLEVWLFERMVKDPDYRRACYESVGISYAPVALKRRNARNNLRFVEGVRRWNSQNWPSEHGEAAADNVPSRQATAQKMFGYHKRLHDAGLVEDDAETFSLRTVEMLGRRRREVSEGLTDTSPELSYELPESLDVELGHVFRRSNRALAARLDEDISALGYDL
jgi:hypothetical protein